MGTNPIGIVFSEYALQDPRAYQYLEPYLIGMMGGQYLSELPTWQEPFLGII